MALQAMHGHGWYTPGVMPFLLSARARRLTGSWILPLTLIGACAQKPKPVPQAPQPASEQVKKEAPKKAPQLARPEKPRPNITYYSADLSVSGLDDLLQSSDKLSQHWGTPRSMPTRDLLATFLNNLGFAANILELVNLGQPFLAHFDLPHDSRALREHFDLAVSVPAKDPGALVRGLPANLKLKSQGASLWKATLSNLELSLRAGSGFLSVARTVKNLGRAEQDRSKGISPQAPRLSLHLDDLSDGQRRAVLNSIPSDLAQRLAPALRELQDLTLSLDLGSERPLVGHVQAHAPWQKLNLPLAAPSQSPSLVAQRLPPGAAGVSQIMLGDTKPIIDQLTQLAQDKVPVPFTDPSVELLAALQNLSQEVSTQVIAAYYVDSKNRGSILFAADLKDNAKGLAAVEALWTALAKGLNTHIELVKNSPEDRYSIQQKNKGPRYFGQRTQSLRVNLPKRMAQDLQPKRELSLAAPLMSGSQKSPRLEGYSFVRDNYAVLALGAGSRDLVKAAIQLAKAKKPGDTLASNQGLSHARSVTQGCQLCGYLDPLPMLRALAVHAAAESGRTQDLRKTLKDLKGIKIDGVISGGAQVASDKGDMAMFVPQSLVYPEPTQAAKLKKAIEGFEVLDDVLPAESAYRRTSQRRE